MSQEMTGVELDRSVGYVLKQASSALRAAMDAVLRPLELTVPQYSCLELLGQRSGLSNAELARGTFVTRQSMNLVLRGLQERGLVTRPTIAARGRTLPTRLTADGTVALHAANRAVARVEQRMLSPLPLDRRQQLREDLAACAAAIDAAVVPG